MAQGWKYAFWGEKNFPCPVCWFPLGPPLKWTKKQYCCPLFWKYTVESYEKYLFSRKKCPFFRKMVPFQEKLLFLRKNDLFGKKSSLFREKVPLFREKRCPFLKKGTLFQKQMPFFGGSFIVLIYYFQPWYGPLKIAEKVPPMGARTRGDEVVKPPKGFSNHLWPPKELIFRFFIYFLFQKFAKFCPPTFFQFLWKYQYSCNF